MDLCVGLLAASKRQKIHIKLRIGPTGNQRPLTNQNKRLKLEHPELWKQNLLTNRH